MTTTTIRNEPKFYCWAAPDAVLSAVCYLQREYGTNGYAITGLESPARTNGEVTMHVIHADGSRFTITADRYGNILA